MLCRVCSTSRAVVPSKCPCFAGYAVLVGQWCLVNAHALQGMQY